MQDSSQFAAGNAGLRNLRWIQYIRVPNEPHIQGKVMKSATWLEEGRKLRSPTMEPTEAQIQPELDNRKGCGVRTSSKQTPRTRTTSVVVLALEPTTALCRPRPG